METLKEKYEKNLKELERNIPMPEQLVGKPFEKEAELTDLKKQVASLESEIKLRFKRTC